MGLERLGERMRTAWEEYLMPSGSFVSLLTNPEGVTGLQIGEIVFVTPKGCQKAPKHVIPSGFIPRCGWSLESSHPFGIDFKEARKKQSPSRGLSRLNFRMLFDNQNNRFFHRNACYCQSSTQPPYPISAFYNWRKNVWSQKRVHPFFASDQVECRILKSS